MIARGRAASLDVEGARKEEESFVEAGEQIPNSSDIDSIITGDTINKKGSPNRPDGEGPSSDEACTKGEL